MPDLTNVKLCPACQKGKLYEARKDLIFKYKNRPITFQHVKVLKCNVCDYEGLSKEANRRVEKGLTDFRRKIDGLLNNVQPTPGR